MPPSPTTASPSQSTSEPLDPASGMPLPGGGYDPMHPQPYTPPSGSDLPPVPPPPPQPSEESMKPTQAPNVAPGKKGSGLAAGAYMADSVLKGFMRGRQQAQEMKNYKANRMAAGLQGAYQTASKRYIDIIKNGGDPNSKEAQEAAAQADAAWNAYMAMISNYMGDGKKSKGGKKGGGGDSEQENPAALLTSKNPADQARGWLMIAQKAGPAYKYQAAQYQTAEYKKQLEIQRQQQGLQASQGKYDADILAQKSRWQELLKIDPKNLTTEQANELERLNKNPEVNPMAARLDKKVGQYNGADNKLHMQWQRPDGSTYETTAESEERAPASQGLGTLPDFMKRVAKEAGINPDDLTAESTQALRQAFAASKINEKITTQNYIYTDKATGQIVVVPLTRKSGSANPAASAVPQVQSESGATPGATATPGAAPSAGAGGAAATPPPAATHKRGRVRDLPAIDKSAPPGATPGATTEAPPPGSPSGARVIGHTLSQPQAKAIQTTTTTYQKMKPLFGLLAAQEDYMNEINKDPKKASPRQDLSMVVAAVRAMNPGSVRLPATELEMEIKAGSWGDQARRWYDKAFTGLLPDDQRKDLFTIIQRETTKAGESIAKDWKQYVTNQPLPEDLKRFDKSTGAGGGAGGGAGAGPAAQTPEQKKVLDQFFPPPAAASSSSTPPPH